MFYKDNDLPVINKPPAGFKFLGGKEDDITVTVAQVFKDVGADDPRRQLSANDKYFPDQKTLYTKAVPSNKTEGFLKARFRSYEKPEGQTPRETVEEMRERILRMMQERQEQG